MDGPRDCHTEGKKSEREKQKPYANTYIWNLKKNGSEDIENELEDTGRGKGKLGQSERVA